MVCNVRRFTFTIQGGFLLFVGENKVDRLWGQKPCDSQEITLISSYLSYSVALSLRSQKISEEVSLPRESFGSSHLRFSTPQRKLLSQNG